MNGIIDLPAEEISPLYTKKKSSFEFVRGNGRSRPGEKYAPMLPETISFLEEKIRLGEMEERDWKCRYDGFFLRRKEEEIIIAMHLGATSYWEWKEDCSRPRWRAKQLQRSGKLQHNGFGYYFSCALAVNVLPRTSEGNIIVGIREGENYNGWIHGVAGWMEFKKDVSKVNPLHDCHRELEEEVGIKKDNVTSLLLLGQVSYPHTLESDIIFLAQLDQPSSYFENGTWKKAVDAKEHHELATLKNREQVCMLLEEGKLPDGKRYQTMPSTQYGLEVIAKNWEKL